MEISVHCFLPVRQMGSDLSRFCREGSVPRQASRRRLPAAGNPLAERGAENRGLAAAAAVKEEQPGGDENQPPEVKQPPLGESVCRKRPARNLELVGEGIEQGMPGTRWPIEGRCTGKGLESTKTADKMQ